MTEGNGEKMVMRRDIEELGEKIDALSVRFEKVELFFDAGGLCEKSRRKVDSQAVHIIIQYGLLVVILVAILGLTFGGRG